MKALVIVDSQNDFMPGGSLEVPKGDEIVPIVNKLQDKFDLIVATQDWHPKNHISFASNHEGKEPFETIEYKEIEQILWPQHCVQGSKGAEFHSDLETHKIEAFIRKGMNPEIDSYSGFYDNGHLKNTGLAGYLREKDCDEIYFCGLAADVCVYFTAKDSLKEGFSSTLISDAIRALDGDKFAKMKEELSAEGMKFTTSGDLPG